MKISYIVVMILLILFSLTNQKWDGIKQIGKVIQAIGKRIVGTVGDSMMTADEKIEELKELLELYDLMLEEEETD